jgi:hypothetical protein
MRLRNLFEAFGEEVAIIFGRFNPPHKGHRAAWELASKSPIWYVGTNESTVGPKDPLPYDVKVDAMKTVWPKVEGHIVSETSWLTLASKVYEKNPNATLLCLTDEDWVTKTIVQYNGKEGTHGFYNFKKIEQKPTPRLSSATALRDAVSKGDRDAFTQAAGVDADTPVAGKPFFDLVAEYLMPYQNAPKKVAKKKVAAPVEGIGEMRGFRGVGGARSRENDENEKIDARLRQQDQQRRDYEQSGKFWLKTKDTQQHISDEFVGKAAANKAALELLKQKPELKGNLLITAYGPDEKREGVAEGEYDSRKPFGVRYKVFAGREGRVTTKEYWTTSSEKLEKAVAKIEALGNFYEIDGYSYPKEKQGMAEATGDVKFDKMIKGITGKKEVAKQQKIDTKQQARDAFGGMFGGGNPVDKLSIRKKGVAEGLDQDIPSVLYHATYKPRLKSIQSKGLGSGGKRNWEDSQRGVVYLALDPDVAESYAETSDMVPDEWLDQIVMLKISTVGLDSNKFGIDSNVQDNAGDTIEYHGVIPVSNISLYKSGVAEGERMKTASGMYRDQHTGVAYRGKTGQDGNDSYMTPDYLIQKYQERLAQIASGPYKRPKEVAQLKSRIAKLQGQQGVAEGFDKLSPQQKAHEYNLDAAQKEMDRRHEQGEDMTGAKIDKKTYKIVKPKQQGVAEGESSMFSKVMGHETTPEAARQIQQQGFKKSHTGIFFNVGNQNYSGGGYGGTVVMAKVSGPIDDILNLEDDNDLPDNLDDFADGEEIANYAREEGYWAWTDGVQFAVLDPRHIQVVKQGVAEGAPIVVMPRADRLKKPEPTKVRYQGDIVPPTKPPSTEKRGVKGRPGQRPMPKYEEAAGVGIITKQNSTVDVNKGTPRKNLKAFRLVK